MDVDWLYQVWVHCDNENTVSVVDTLKSEWEAQKCADMRNAAARRDTKPDYPPRRYYFVRPILFKDLQEQLAKKYKQDLWADTEYFMKQYRGDFAPYAEEMVGAMLHSIETCVGYDHFMLDEKGGWLEGYCKEYDSGCMITCSALYSGHEKVSLEVAFVRNNIKNGAFAMVFNDEKEFISWLYNTPVAARCCEEKLIEICCDRYRNLNIL